MATKILIKRIVKQLLLIGSGTNIIATTSGDHFQMEYDIEALFGTCEFSLPYAKFNAPVDLTKLKKYDTVKLYYGDFDVEPGEMNESFINNGITIVFDGYIDSIKLKKNKEGFDYRILAMGTLGLANERTVPLALFNSIDAVQMTADILTATDLSYTINDELGTSRVLVNIDGGTSVREMFSKIKEKYAVIIHQTGDGIVRVMTPFFLAADNNIEAFDFVMADGNIFDIDYGDLTSYINTVVCMGLPTGLTGAGPIFGVAFDPILLSLNNNKFNYRIIHNRDLGSVKDCEEVARNKLLEILRNFAVTFQTLYSPLFRVGMPFTISDDDRFTGNELFICSKLVVTISKNDVSSKITGFTQSLTILPSQYVEGFGNSFQNILDIDVIQAQPKITNIANWVPQ